MSSSVIATGMGSPEGCKCMRPAFPPLLSIMAGLDTIPRQIAGFSEFRSAMLTNLRSKNPLRFWHVRDSNDPGIMLLEMWACICDSIAFYDQVIANEVYLRTAKERASLTKLASLLGYQPRPAVASVVLLAAGAEGRQLLKIPQRTAFRSGAFDGNPPQVFETIRDQYIHPFTNRWSIEPPVNPSLIITDPSELLLDPVTVLKTGMILLLDDSDNDTRNQVAEIRDVTPYKASDKKVYTKVVFRDKLKLKGKTLLSDLKLMIPVRKAKVKGISISSRERKPDTLILDNLYPEIAVNDHIIIARGKEFKCYTVTDTGVADIKATHDVTVTIDGHTCNIPGNTVEATRITLDRIPDIYKTTQSEQTSSVSLSLSDLIVYFDLCDAGRIVNEPEKRFYPSGSVSLLGNVEKPAENFSPERFLIHDNDEKGYALKGKIDYDSKTISLQQNEVWNSSLMLPADICGNVIEATRGESIRQEILGSGDASLANQSFKLKKKPLTYLFQPSSGNDPAVKSELEIRVGGILWSEVPGFFNTSANDRVFTVRQNEESETIITFGDGINGQRLPSGKDNVVAAYRFGAGKSVPPVRSVSQVATPVKGLRSIFNPVVPLLGADRESADEIRSAIPKAAMLLDRVISIRDMEAAVISVPGVRNTLVEWRWSGTGQGTMMHVYYIGETEIRNSIIQFLNTISDPNLNFCVEPALPVSLNVSIDLYINNRYDKEERIATAADCLLSPGKGLLSPEVAGIGKSIFRSHLCKALISLPGIIGLGNITWNGKLFTAYAAFPGSGAFFDIDGSRLLLNGIYTQP